MDTPKTTTERRPYPLIDVAPPPGASPLWYLQVHQGRQVLRLAWPTVLAMLSHTLMWTVDTALLGRVGSVALAAAGLGGVLTWTAYSLVNQLSRISGTFVSQAHGRDDDEAIGDYTWQGLYIAIVAGALLQALGYYSHLALPWTRNPGDVQTLAYTYIKWRTLSAGLTQVSFCLMGFFQGRQKVMVPMWAGLVGNVANIVLDLWLIFGWGGFALAGRTWLAVPAMGVEGAAIATSLGQLINTAILAVAAVWPAENRQRFRIHMPRRPDLSRIGRLVRVGAPAAWENFVDMTGFSAFAVIVGTTGAVALAATQISIQLLSFSFMPIWGLTVAGSVLTGNWIGARNPSQAAAYGRQVYKVGVYYSVGLGLLFLTLRHEVFRIFTPDPDILALGAAIVLILAPFQVFDGLRMISIGLLQGAGDTRFPMLASMVVLWGGFIPGVWWVVVHGGGGVVDAWFVACAAYIVQCGVMYARFRSGAWQKIDIWESGHGITISSS